MARQRIGKKPLTDAEKQSRYRQKKKDDINARTEKVMAKVTEDLREKMIGYIYGLSYDELVSLCDKICRPENYLKKYCTLDELSERTGVPLHDLKNLERKGVIQAEPEEEAHTPEFTLKELSEFSGLSVSELKGFIAPERRRYYPADFPGP